MLTLHHERDRCDHERERVCYVDGEPVHYWSCIFLVVGRDGCETPGKACRPRRSRDIWGARLP